MRCAGQRGSASLSSEVVSEDVQESPESPGGTPCALLKDGMWSVESYIYGRKAFRYMSPGFCISGMSSVSKCGFVICVKTRI